LGEASGRQTTQLQKQTVTNKSLSNKTNNASANSSQSAASRATTNGNGAAALASTSATDTVEGWVSDNLSTFLADPDSGPHLPGLSTQKAPSRAQRAAFESQTVPATQKAGSNGLRAPAPRTDSAPSPSTQQQQQQSWGSVKQKGPAGAWQGRGQGPAGGSGGSWATVDDNMENARRLLSPWRFAFFFLLYLFYLLPMLCCHHHSHKHAGVLAA